MRIAAVDMGTNTFILLVVDIEHGRIQRILHDQVEIVRLGQGVDVHRRLHPEALLRAEEALGKFSAVLKNLRPDKTGAFATSAARDASNSDELIKMGEKVGIPIQIISGEFEAELTFLGVKNELHSPQALIIDIGGGSTEFIIGNQSGINRRKSLDIGSVRLTEKLITAHPIPPSQIAKLNSEIDAHLARELTELKLEKGAQAIAVAGTATTLAAIDLGRSFDREQIEKHRLSVDRLEFWLKRMSALSIDERRKLDGMEPKRADVIVAGAAILLQSLKRFSLRDTGVSTRGVRFGAALAMAGPTAGPTSGTK